MTNPAKTLSLTGNTKESRPAGRSSAQGRSIGSHAGSVWWTALYTQGKDRRVGHPEEIGAEVNCCADCQPAGGGAPDAQPIRLCVARL